MYRVRIIAAGIVLLAACSDSPTDNSDVTTSTDAAVTLDAASIAADGAAEDVDMMAALDGAPGNLSATSSAALWMPPGPPRLTGCTFANGGFTCPSELRNGLTVTRTITFRDAVGATQANYDATTTASITVHANISGSVTRGPWSADVQRMRDFVISGLAGTETTRTINGTGSEQVSRERDTRNGTRSYDVTGTSTAVNVVIPVRTDGSDPWPISGTITRNLTFTATDSAHAGETRTRVVIITFNGTPTPTATVNGESVTIDLAHRHAERRRR